MRERRVFRGLRSAGRAAALGLVLLAAAALAEPGATLRVGTSGDYPPFSHASKGKLPSYEGFDVEIARRYAADRGLELEFVRFAWPTLLHDLEEGRFEVAMSGVTVGPARSTAGSFSVPVVETEAVVLVRDPSRFENLVALDREHVRIGVNAGGYLESVAREKFPRAILVTVPENAGVARALAKGAVDAAVTDSVEAAIWSRDVPDAARLGPLSHDRKAYLWASGSAARAADLDAWLLEREADGTLDALRRDQLGAGPWQRVAAPLPALVAALDERLSLMPWVGVAKRRAGLPLLAPAREAAVIEEATSAVLAAARARDVKPPSVLLVRGFFQAQFEAARQVQRDALRDGALDEQGPVPDLDGALRPAISRIGARIARLLVALPTGMDRARIEQALAEGLRSPWLAPSSRYRIADALAEIAAAPGAEAPPAPTAPPGERAH